MVLAWDYYACVLYMPMSRKHVNMCRVYGCFKYLHSYNSLCEGMCLYKNTCVNMAHRIIAIRMLYFIHVHIILQMHKCSNQ